MEVEEKAGELVCTDEEALSHLLNIYGEQEQDVSEEGEDSDDESEAGPESDADDDRIEEFVKEESEEPVEDIKECPD